MDKKLLIEHMILDNISKTQLKEDIDGEIKDTVVFKNIKIWELDTINLNGRTYPTELAEMIVNENKITFCFDGHPFDEINTAFKDVKAVAKNPRVEENFLKVDLHFVDTSYVKKLEKVLDLGGNVGVSSVGYGLLDEKNVIIPETYQLVRYCDMVLEPANGIYIAKEKEEVEMVPEMEEEEIIEVETSTEDEEATVSVNLISNDELEDILHRFEVKKNG